MRIWIRRICMIFAFSDPFYEVRIRILLSSIKNDKPCFLLNSDFCQRVKNSNLGFLFCVNLWCSKIKCKCTYLRYATSKNILKATEKPIRIKTSWIWNTGSTLVRQKLKPKLLFLMWIQIWILVYFFTSVSDRGPDCYMCGSCSI